ncbi:hypothetical protein BS47DRAFT_1409176 [Hydnum rufescens UP504]|uniref:Actin-like ATPase domain-containing protein n=1 Tax=Hydnum rufescens UP504 TaxID=1448309 RepID=A0A9P6ARI9_9AGAM|nr:hypothetical protein BS47DRAFT_1409176 [Hydnum rufescens UP504]
MGGSSSRLGQSSQQRERSCRVPLYSASANHPRSPPINSRGAHSQKTSSPTTHDSAYTKIDQQCLPTSRYPTSPILFESSTRAHGTIDHQRPLLVHPVHFPEYIPDPHQPNPSPHLPEVYPPPDAVAEGPSCDKKSFVFIDFGAAYSGVSYGTSAPGEVHPILVWPGSSHSSSKVPTCLVYDSLRHIRAWGFEAKDMGLKKGWIRCEWFKLWLDPRSAPRTVITSEFLQPPKNVVALVADYLACIWTHTKNQIHRENGPCSLGTLSSIPSSWDFHASSLLQEAAIKAGLVVQDSESEDIYWEERLHIIPETEASVIRSFYSPAFKSQWEGLTICDAGGATIDLANVQRALGSPKIAEAAARTGSYSGSLFLDLRFRELVQERLAAHPAHLDEASLVHFVRLFSRSQKLDYKGAEDDIKLFRFRCFHDEDSHDPAVGLDHGELVIPGDVLRREVFDPVIGQVLCSIAAQVQASKVHVDVLLLVGGFSTNEYLFQRIAQQFGSSVGSIIRPADGDTAWFRGGVRFDVGSPISSVIQPQNVFRRVALPTELEDRTMRPAYITNVAGRSFCEYRVEYIVRRGVSVVKGCRNELQVRKLCISQYDRALDIVLYTSNGEESNRYFDQEQGEELCRCHIDLGTYPSFLEQVEASPLGNFYVDFVLGFEMDTAEIRCALLYKGVKCGSVACHPCRHLSPPV